MLLPAFSSSMAFRKRNRLRQLCKLMPTSLLNLRSRVRFDRASEWASSVVVLRSPGWSYKRVQS